MKKLSYEYVKNFIEKEGYELLSTEYINSLEKLEVKCPKDHIYKVTYGKFQSGRRCPYCSNRIKITKEDVIKHVESEGYKLISDFKNGNEPIILECPNNHHWKVVYQKFKKGRRCSHCSNKYKKYNGHTNWNYELVKEYLNNEEYELLSNEYINSHTKILVKCPEGHIIDIYFSHFTKGHRCRKCSGIERGKNKLLDIKYIDKVLAENGYKRIGEYAGVNNLMKVICNNGHETEIRFGNFSKGVRCKFCYATTYERKIIDYFDTLNIKYDKEYSIYTNDRYMWLDFVVFDEKENIVYALEVDGHHHFNEVNIFNTSLKIYQKRDAIKNNYCKENNIKLYRIPYWEIENNEVENLFNDNIPLTKFLIK